MVFTPTIKPDWSGRPRAGLPGDFKREEEEEGEPISGDFIGDTALSVTSSFLTSSLGMTISSLAGAALAVFFSTFTDSTSSTFTPSASASSSLISALTSIFSGTAGSFPPSSTAPLPPLLVLSSSHFPASLFVSGYCQPQDVASPKCH